MSGPALDPTGILALAKANQESYLTAYRIGYEQGWKDAIDKAMEIMKRDGTVKELSNVVPKC